MDSRVRAEVSSAALCGLHNVGDCRDRLYIICHISGPPGLCFSDAHSPYDARSLSNRNELFQVFSLLDFETCRFSFVLLLLAVISPLCAGRAHSWFKTVQVNWPSRTFSQN